MLASEIRYRRLFETAKDGILLLDADTGQITDVNPFLQDLLSYSRDELLGRTLWEIGPLKDIASSQSAFRQLQSQEYVRYENLPLEAKDGQRRQVEFVSNVYLVNGRRVIQCNIRDITARKQTEAEVRKVNEALLVLVAELKKRDQEMQLLNRMNGLLQACTTRIEAYRVISLIAADLFAGQSGGLAMMHPGDLRYEVVARWGNHNLMENIYSWEDCWAMRRGQIHEVLNPQFGLFCRHFVQQPETGYLCIPLMVQGETFGVVCLIGGVREGEAFGDQAIAIAVGEAIKLALSNIALREELHEQAIRDPLTGLFNRRYLDDCLTRELSRAQRQATPLCVTMLDIDHFKDINDTLGHVVGDALLSRLGLILRENLRASDIACRFGGDEFVLILPDSSLDDTRHRLQQVLEQVKKLRIWADDHLLSSPTLSAGIALAGDHNFDGRKILQAADEALYSAKLDGRDVVVIDTLKRRP